MERWKTELLPLLPDAAQAALREVGDEERLTEIRLRAELPMQLVFETRDRMVYATGGKPMLRRYECADLLSRFCGRSVYAWENELAKGFLTVAGGYRVGVAGRAITENGRVRYTEIEGFCIRIVRELRDAAKPLLPYVTENRRLLSTLLLSPPNCGKTTIMRDLVRIASHGLYGVRPHRVCLADERFELSGDSDGRRAFDLGVRTDVVSGLPKADALERMLTALSPEVLATDELSQARDMLALHHARAAGVAVLATAHGGTRRELLLHPVLKKLHEDRIFDRIVLLADRPHPGTPQTVWDADGRILFGTESVG